MKKAKALGAIAGLAIIGAAATAGAAYAD
jgi:hypothetical protein